MLDLGPHASFIIASYCVTTVVLTVLIWHSVAGFKAAKRQLVALQSSDTDGKGDV